MRRKLIAHLDKGAKFYLICENKSSEDDLKYKELWNSMEYCKESLNKINDFIKTIFAKVNDSDLIFDIVEENAKKESEDLIKLLEKSGQ